MGRQTSTHKKRLAEEDEEMVREDYVQKMRDNYPLIIRTLMHDVIVSVDKNGNLVFLNDAAVEFWGTSSEELIGTHFLDYLYPEDVEKAQIALQEIIESKGQVKGLIVRVKSPKGARKVAWNAVAIFDEAGNYVGIQATGKDLTDLLQTEDELEQSRSHFRRLFEVIVDPIVIVDMAGKILEVSQSAEDILGFPREELVGKHFLETKVAKADTEAVMIKNLERMKKGMYISPYAIEAVTKDGKKLFYEVNPARIVYKGEPAILAIFRNLTEQKKVEQKLQESEERFNYFIENAPEAIWVQDVNGIFLDGNKRAEELTGYKREELLGKIMLEILVSPESVPRLLEAFRSDKLGEISGPHEVKMIRKDGSLVSVEASIIPVEREGKIEIIGVTRDITERKIVEQKLKELKERYRRQFEEALDAIILVDAKTGIIVDCNIATTKLVGRTKSEIIGKQPQIFHPPDPTGKVGRAFRQHVKKTNGRILEAPIITKSGEIRNAAIKANIIEMGDKKLVQAIFRDITERKKAENALKENEEKFRTIFEGATDGIAALDPKTMKVIFTNPKMTEITGYAPDELQNATIIDFVPKDEVSSVTQQFQNHMGGKRDLTRYIPVIRKDKTQIYCDVRSKFMNIGDQQYLMAFVRDVTEQKKAEEALWRSEEEAKRLLEFQKKVIDTATVWVNLVDTKGNVILWNRAAELISGYSREEVIGHKKMWKWLYPDPDYRAKIFAVGKEINEEGKRLEDYESTIRCKDGSLKTISWYATTVLDKKGKPAGSIAIGIDITERKKTEEDLKESEERFRSTLDSMLEGCQIVDYNWRYLYVNDAGARHARLAKKDLLGKTIMEAHPGIEKTELFPVLRRCMNERVPTHLEYEYMFPNGEKNWFKLSIEPMPDGIFVLSIDINDRKRAEKELIRLSNAVRVSTDSIVITDLDGTVLDLNEAAMKMYDVDDKRDLIGKNFLELVTLEEPEKMLAGMKEVLEKGYVQSREYNGITKDGNKIHVETSTAIMKDADGKPMGFVSISRDITERKKAVEALRDSEKKYRDMINAMNDTALVLDFDTNIIDANQTAVEVLGYSREELLSMKVQKLDASLTAEDIKGLAKKMETRGLLVFETTHTTKDGKTFPVEISASHVTYQGKPAILSIARDITERKKAQEAIREANGLLKQSNSELESYTYVVSHDLKAPLRTIRSFGSFLLEDYGDKLDETGQDYLQRMVNASAHMNAMIEDLLILSRVGRKFTEFEKVDLNKLIKEILTDLEATIKERNAKIVVDKLPALSVQRVWMRQLFMNLINNGLKFNESKTPKIEVLHQERENDHLFKIQDNGIGIEKKYLERIFNLFDRAPTEKKYKGTGAGLAICKKIVEHLGGEIWVESTPGKGSTFMFTIPKEMKQEKES